MVKKKRIPFDVPEAAHDKLAGIAKRLGFTSSTELIRASLADFCQHRGEAITVEEMSLGQWGGRREPSDTERVNP